MVSVSTMSYLVSYTHIISELNICHFEHVIYFSESNIHYTEQNMYFSEQSKTFGELNICHGEHGIYFNERNIHCSEQKVYFSEHTKTFGELYRLITKNISLADAISCQGSLDKNDYSEAIPNNQGLENRKAKGKS